MVRPGEQWGAPCDEPPDIVVEGTDHDLALAVTEHPGALIRFVPDGQSDIARAIGLRTGAEPRNWALPMDALQIEDGRVAVNMIILGTPPNRITWRTRAFPLHGHDPALAVVVATGQFRCGCDVVPRGHPGDGWAELQLYRLPARERAAFRRRLATGTHLPHPFIQQTRTRTFTLQSPKPISLELDGIRSGHVTDLTIQLVPNAYRLLL